MIRSCLGWLLLWRTVLYSILFFFVMSFRKFISCKVFRVFCFFFVREGFFFRFKKYFRRVIVVFFCCNVAIWFLEMDGREVVCLVYLFVGFVIFSLFIRIVFLRSFSCIRFGILVVFVIVVSILLTWLVFFVVLVLVSFLLDKFYRIRFRVSVLVLCLLVRYFILKLKFVSLVVYRCFIVFSLFLD